MFLRSLMASAVLLLLIVPAYPQSNVDATIQAAIAQMTVLLNQAFATVAAEAAANAAAPPPVVTPPVTTPPVTTPPVTTPPTTNPPAAAGSNISAVWANEGGDKVSQDELRASHHTENLTGTVNNRAWDGTTIKLAAARNEVVSFNLVLEAATTAASHVSVSFHTLTGPNGATITSQAATGNGVFSWVGRNIELFYTRYLQIKGLSFFGYYKGDERLTPVRFQRPWTGNGVATGGWTNRPDHDKFYPDILVPLELVSTFNIAQGKNQSIWADIYVPKSAAPGTYTGAVTVSENGTATRSVPVSLTVQSFALPDTPAAKTMLFVDATDIMWRYATGHSGYVNWNSTQGAEVSAITDKYYELLHRHKIATIGENDCPVSDNPCATSVPRINGSLFTAANGYDGPGVNTPNGVFSIGTYGAWGNATYGIAAWRTNQTLFKQHIDNWGSWFRANAPNSDYFLYIEDEPQSSDFTKVNQWAQWMASDTGAGHYVTSFSTVSASTAQVSLPALQAPTTPAGIGNCPPGQTSCDNTSVMQSAMTAYSAAPKRMWMYNDGRPGVGTFDTESDGVDPRTLGWAQFKKGIQRWFYWYANLNSPTDWFAQATTWGSDDYFDSVLGWTGDDAKTNGNGVLVYPGTDLGNPSDSYGVNGPFASQRLKEWRRGIQDADYLALAKSINPTATQAIINAVMPKALWENPAPGGDPSYFIGPISWSSNPDDWEAARAQLATIIANACHVTPSASYCQ